MLPRIRGNIPKEAFIMFKKLIRIQKDIFYSPTHNTFFRVEPSEPVDFRDFLLEISGHEEKIFEFLISNYNNYVSKETLENEFPECSDPYDKTLDRLRRDKLEGKLKLYGLIKKTQGRAILYLSESPFSADETLIRQDAPLLCRTDYYVDYDRILSDCAPEQDDGSPQSILHKWIRECGEMQRFDEKCLMLLERIGFLPAFGKKADKKWFLARAKELIYRFDASEVRDYGGTELLLFARNVLLAVIGYIELQLQIIIPDTGSADPAQSFAHLLQRFRLIRMPEQTAVNPLLLTAYYDYFGLVLYRSDLFQPDDALKAEAIRAAESALENARKVDLHLQIWSAFLTYNLARNYAAVGKYPEALRNIRTAVMLRQGLAESPFFTDALKHNLFFEYLLGRIVQTDIEQQANVLSAREAQDVYAQIYAEMQDNYQEGDSGDSQPYIQRLLESRMEQGTT